jgi:ATP-dependent Clp protease, protease subunit
MSVIKYALIGVTLGVTAAIALANNHSPVATKTRKITLEEKNTVSLRLPFMGGSVQTVQAKLLELSNSLPPGEPIYLFMDTPGGSIGAGENLIQTSLALNREVKTISNFAASMGYLTAQSLGERIVTPNGILMAHRAYVGIEGQIPGEFNTFAAFIQSMVRGLEERTATRMGISHKDYEALVKDEYWRIGAHAVKENAADSVAQVTCSSSLSGTYAETLQTMFGPVDVIWAKCPLLLDPVAINFSNMNFASYAEEQRITQQLREALQNRRALAKDKAMLDNFLKIVK